VALLRALGIPAGFHVMAVKTKEYFGCLCTPRFNRFMSDRSVHVYGAVLLGGKWLKIGLTQTFNEDLLKSSKLVLT